MKKAVILLFPILLISGIYSCKQNNGNCTNKRVSGERQMDTRPITSVSVERSETEITLEITPEETGAFYKTVRVHCNVENGDIPLIIKRNGKSKTES
jgi:hypothetical protein